MVSLSPTTRPTLREVHAELLRLHASLQAVGQSAEHLRPVWGIPTRSSPQKACSMPTSSSKSPHAGFTCGLLEPPGQQHAVVTMTQRGIASKLPQPLALAVPATAAHVVTKKASLRKPAPSRSPGQQEVSGYLYCVPSWVHDVHTCAVGAVKGDTRTGC